MYFFLFTLKQNKNHNTFFRFENSNRQKSKLRMHCSVNHLSVKLLSLQTMKD